MNALRPEILADKFAAAANFYALEFAGALRTHSRLREALWAMQAHSLAEGGRKKFFTDGIARCPGHFGTATMFKLKDKRSYVDYERDAILREIPHRLRACNRPSTPAQSWLTEHLWMHVQTGDADCAPGVAPLMERNHEFVASLNHAFFHELCAKFAAEFLPAELVRVCTVRDACLAPQWYCPDPLAAILDMLDACAAVEERSVAKTEVVALTFDALQFALATKSFVRIDGNSRYGKSESIRAFAAAHPGLARIVNTHCMNSETEFFQCIAEPLGIVFDYTTPARQLRMKIEHIMRYSGLMLIFDEAHYLMPSKASKVNRPVRLDWVRTQLVDRRCPVVFVTTPQVFNADVVRFRKVTGYNFDQWDGRIRRHVKLPEKISAADALAVVRHKAPEFQPGDHELIEVSASIAASVAGNYLGAVQSIVDTARWKAARAGRKTPSSGDVERAIAEVTPVAVPQPGPENQSIPAPRSVKPAPVRNASSPRPAAPSLKLPARGVTVSAPETPALEMSAPETAPFQISD